MTIASLAEVIRAHLNKNNLELARPTGEPISDFEFAFALRDLAEVAKDATEIPDWLEERTEEIPSEYLERLRTMAA